MCGSSEIYAAPSLPCHLLHSLPTLSPAAREGPVSTIAAAHTQGSNSVCVFQSERVRVQPGAPKYAPHHAGACTLVVFVDQDGIRPQSRLPPRYWGQWHVPPCGCCFLLLFCVVFFFVVVAEELYMHGCFLCVYACAPHRHA